MATLPELLIARAEAVSAMLRNNGLMLATAESCTGGLIAASMTELPGSSDVYERGFVTYANEAKCELLGVPQTLLAEYGAVSDPVARAMAEGAIQHACADIAVAVTGVAGPGGGTDEKPVGLVFVAGARRGRETVVERHMFAGNRGEIREATAFAALDLALSLARS